jgi:sugar transferase (PEP-CTERM/EpsH1 system associated)
MGDVLFLAHRIPYPPDKGDKIRSWPMLRHLSERATVHLGAFVDDPADFRHADVLRERCRDVLLHPLRRRDKAVRGLHALRRGEALSLAFYRDPAMIEWVRDVVRRRDISAILVFSGQMAPYALPYLSGRRSVMDFVDVDSEKWRQYSEEQTGWRGRIYAREAKLLRDFEKQAARQFDCSLFVSDAEAALFKRISGSYGHAVAVLSNGVDYQRFDPDGSYDPITPPGEPMIAFTGAMDYKPNVDAATWFAAEVWPRVRAEMPQAAFAIVGSSPTAEVQGLGGREGIVVTGRVPQVQPWLAAAAVAVAPLRIARGIQNKVLEAMAMARPVVASSAALEGISATPGEHLLVADAAEDMAGAVLGLLRDPERARALGASARARVTSHYDWGTNLRALDAMLGLDEPAQPERSLA